MDENNKTIVIGAGVTGLSIGFALAEKGENVIIVDSSDKLASGASFSNAGLLTSSMSEPWNSPGILKYIIRSLYDKRSPFRVNYRNIAGSMKWGYSFLRNSNSAQYAHATEANFLLAKFSVEKTNELSAKYDIQYNHNKTGSIKIFQNKSALMKSLEHSKKLERLGLKFNNLSREEVVIKEPLLQDIKEMIVGGIFFPNDESGDSYKFCLSLVDLFRKRKGEIRLGVKVNSINVESDKVVGVETSHGVIKAKRVILTAGHTSPKLLKEHAIHLPIRPIKGYTITFETDSLRLPNIPVIDDEMHSVVTGLGNRLRISGIAELAGEDVKIKSQYVEILKSYLRQLYPKMSDALLNDIPEQWSGLRPVSSDGLPFIGGTRTKGLYINTGHGHLGWTMAVGSGYLLANYILGNKLDISLQPYAINRKEGQI